MGGPVDVRVAHASPYACVVRGGAVVRFERFMDTALVRRAMST
ncbi:hypothetical protein [Streptomyces sp. NPDC001348]